MSVTARTQPSILITGCGVVGSFGVGEQALANVLSKGVSCFGVCTLFNTPYKVAQVRDFYLTNHIKNPRAERSPRISQYALAAAAMAIEQSKLAARQVGSNSTAVVYGTSDGPTVSTERSLNAIVTKGLDAVEPLTFQESVFNAPASLISIQFGIKGPVVVLPIGWTAGTCALKQGCDLLLCGHAQRVLVVAAEELAGATCEAYRRLGFITPNDGGIEATRPFTQYVNGANFGEGAVAVMLELAGDVQARGGKGRARVAACGIGSDALGQPEADTSGGTIARVMRHVFIRAGRGASDIDHVIAGTIITKASDLAEINGLLTLLGECTRTVPITSIKANIGETRGPGGLFNLVAGILELESGMIFGNPGLERIVQGPIAFPKELEKTVVRSVLVNATGPLGIYASALLEAI